MAMEATINITRTNEDVCIEAEQVNVLSEQLTHITLGTHKYDKENSEQLEQSISNPKGNNFDAAKKALILEPSTDNEDRILLVGEGSFDFTVQLVVTLKSKQQDRILVEELRPFLKKIPTSNIFATELRSFDRLIALYTKVQDNIKKLEENTVKVLFEVDATKLHQQDWASDKQFSIIIWNAPFAEDGPNGQLLLEFFTSASKIQDKGHRIFLRLTTSVKFRNRYQFDDWEPEVDKIYSKKKIENVNTIIEYNHRRTIIIGSQQLICSMAFQNLT